VLSAELKNDPPISETLEMGGLFVLITYSIGSIGIHSALSTLHSALNKPDCYIVDIGPRGSREDQAVHGLQGVVGVIVPEDLGQ